MTKAQRRPRGVVRDGLVPVIDRSRDALDTA
jgi:hypothetical protein